MSVRSALKTKGSRVVTVGTKAPVSEVVEILARERIGAVVVSDDGVTVAGMLSERDLIQGLARTAQHCCRSQLTG